MYGLADKFVSLGWGHSDTQFRGSIGKSAQRNTNVTTSYDTLSPENDDFTPTISWRADGAHFAISSVDAPLASTSTATYRRTIRFYSRTASLLSTSELSPGLEPALAWQPSGSIIAATMKTRSSESEFKRDVIFYERNGLRRYDFPLRGSEQQDVEVKQLAWNADSSLLAVWLSGRSGSDSGEAPIGSGQLRRLILFSYQYNCGLGTTIIGI